MLGVLMKSASSLTFKGKIATIIKGKNYTRIGLYKCSCGKSHCNDISEVNRGRVVQCKSCRQSKIDTTKGSAYMSWKSMKSRCRDSNNEYYGAKGITFCKRWLVFSNFLSDMGDRPEGTSIDRINNDGNYEPDNCRWATALQQVHNRG